MEFYNLNNFDRKKFYYNKIKIYNKFYIPCRLSLSSVILVKIKKNKKSQYLLNKMYMYKTLDNKFFKKKFVDYFNINLDFNKYDKNFKVFNFHKILNKKENLKLPYLFVDLWKLKTNLYFIRYLDFWNNNISYLENLIDLYKTSYNYIMFYNKIKLNFVVNIKSSLKKYFILNNNIKYFFKENFIFKKLLKKHYNYNYNVFSSKNIFKYKNEKLIQRINKLLIRYKIWNKGRFYKWFLEYIKNISYEKFHYNYRFNKSIKFKFNKKCNFNNSIYTIELLDVANKSIYKKKLTMHSYLIKFYYFIFIIDLSIRFKFWPYIFKRFFFIYSFITRVFYNFFYNLKFFIVNIKKNWKRFLDFFSLLNVALLYNYYKKWLIVKRGKSYYKKNSEIYFEQLRERYAVYKQKISDIRRKNRYKFLNFFKRKAIKKYKFKLRKIRLKMKTLKYIAKNSFLISLKKGKEHVIQNWKKIKETKKNKYRFSLFFENLKRDENNVNYRYSKYNIWYKGLTSDEIKKREKKRFRFYVKERITVKDLNEIYKKIRIKE